MADLGTRSSGAAWPVNGVATGCKDARDKGVKLDRKTAFCDSCAMRGRSVGKEQNVLSVELARG
jgi:hypothetical protein